MNENVAECVGWERVSDVVGPEAVRDSVRENDAERVGAGVIVAVPGVRLTDAETLADRVRPSDTLRETVGVPRRVAVTVLLKEALRVAPGETERLRLTEGEPVGAAVTVTDRLKLPVRVGPGVSVAVPWLRLGDADNEAVRVGAGVTETDEDGDALLVEEADGVGSCVALPLWLSLDDREKVVVRVATVDRDGVKLKLEVRVGAGDTLVLVLALVDRVVGGVIDGVPRVTLGEMVEEADRVAAPVTDEVLESDCVRLNVSDRVLAGVTVPLRLPLIDREKLAERVAAGVLDAVTLKLLLRVGAGVTVADDDTDRLRLKVSDGVTTGEFVELRLELSDCVNVAERVATGVIDAVTLLAVRVGTVVAVCVALGVNERVAWSVPDALRLTEPDRLKDAELLGAGVIVKERLVLPDAVRAGVTVPE